MGVRAMSTENETVAKRGPGRPRKEAPETTKQDDDFKPKATRRKRVPLGGMVDQLSAPQRNGYHRHWFKNTPMRRQQAEQAGYESVTGMEEKLAGADQYGKPESLVLMEIPQKWHDEDQALKQRQIDKAEREIALANEGRMTKTRGPLKD